MSSLSGSRQIITFHKKQKADSQERIKFAEEEARRRAESKRKRDCEFFQDYIDSTKGVALGFSRKHAIHTYQYVAENDTGFVEWCDKQECPSKKMKNFLAYVEAVEGLKRIAKETETAATYSNQKRAYQEIIYPTLPIIESSNKRRRVKPPVWDWNPNAQLHFRNNNPDELPQSEKNAELVHHICRIFMSSYNNKTTLEDGVKWLEKETNNGNIRIGSVLVRHDPNCLREYVDENGFLHTDREFYCWCTTKIMYLCIISHINRRDDEMIIGSTCLKYFDGRWPIKKLCDQVMKRLKDSTKGLYTHCQNNECRRPLTDRRSWIRKEAGFCDNKCAGFICEYPGCDDGVANKTWVHDDYSDDWKSSFCCNDHYKLMNGYKNCEQCSRVFKPDWITHTLCKTCWKSGQCYNQDQYLQTN